MQDSPPAGGLRLYRVGFKPTGSLKEGFRSSLPPSQTFACRNVTGIPEFSEFKGSEESIAAIGKLAVIGKLGKYEALGAELGAKTFSVPPRIYEKMSEAEKWAANTRFLDRQIARGATFRLTGPLGEATGVFKREVDYLLAHGYQPSEDGLFLNP